MYEQFFNAMGWKQIGAIAESGQEFPEYHLLLQDHLQQSGISVVVKRNIVRNTDTLDVSQVAIFEPRSEKTGLRGFRPGLTQTRLYSHSRWLEA